jgi:hypothetical protein
MYPEEGQTAKERGEEKRKGELKTTGQKQKKISSFNIYIKE